VWPAILIYVGAFVVALGSNVALVIAVALSRASGAVTRVPAEATSFALSAPGMMASAALSGAVLVGAALLGARLGGLAKRPLGEALRLGPTRARPLGIAAAVLGMIGLSLACGATADLAGLGDTGVMPEIAHVLASSSPPRFALALLTIAVVPGVAEETFFRGYLQARLVARWGRWPAIAGSAAAFGLIHLDPVQGTQAMIAGVYFGWVVERLGGIRPTIVAHAINNALFVAGAVLAGGDEDASRTALVVLVAAAMLVLVACVAVLRSRLAAAEPDLTASRSAA
jgi:membrane protease YdiL (CAAX protease family)